ncbi:MAG: hypothetical protein EOO10_06040 [Chitinophagaceae bacterium]|nr:MAG: hypothetical protein EOO10_06040 [Chitinophagaceae bacterium]
MKRYTWLAIVVLLLACNNNGNTEKINPALQKEKKSSKVSEDNSRSVKSTKLADEPTTNSDADILNNISLHESGGLKVAQAFLTFEDGKLLPKSNETSLGMPVYLNLSIEKGWEINDGQSAIDATEIITTHDGEIVLNAPNLFKATPTIDAKDATRILLKANITKTRPNIDYFVVNYRVWDKWSDAEVKGSYKLYVKDEAQNQK